MKNFIKSILPLFYISFPTVLGLLVFSSNPELTEKVYSDFLYVGITRIITFLFGWIPISISELLLVLLIPALIFLIILVILKRMKPLRGLYVLIFSLCTLFSWFYFSWGFNYLRQPMTERLAISSAVADSTLIKQALQSELDNANKSYLVYANFDKEGIEAEIEKMYMIVEQQLGIKLPQGIRQPKKLQIHAILNKTMTSGIFSPFFHEVHVNQELLPIQYPIVLAHEKAHQMGIANEAEANFLAYLVCTSSENPQLRYSAHFSQVSKLLRRAYTTIGDYNFYRQQVRPEINADFKRVRDHWLKHAGIVADFSHKAYDKYLKANRIKEGVKNYAGDIDMLIWWKLKKGNSVKNNRQER
ncbi:MAG: DUF3810 domain-containing protein [Calditrichaeota bacterium]|nr:MAG: DUF3810 domain-containing protein [Calditrichota bacterium]